MNVVLLSGGLDSAVLLAHIQNTIGGGRTVALSVDYGQRHHRELWSAFQIAHYYGAEHQVAKLPPELFAGSALTRSSLPTLRASQHYAGGCTVVPGRNLVFISLAVALAAQQSQSAVFLASTVDDHLVYPDCREEFIAAVDSSASLGYGVRVVAPFAGLSKRQVIERGRELVVPLDMTWSCYNPQDYDPSAPASGMPCGKCGACEVRKAALA